LLWVEFGQLELSSRRVILGGYGSIEEEWRSVKLSVEAGGKQVVLNQRSWIRLTFSFSNREDPWPRKTSYGLAYTEKLAASHSDLHPGPTNIQAIKGIEERI
jgi:hypothetical protein